MYLVRIEILCLNIFFDFVLLIMLFLNDILNFENARSFYFVSYYYTFKVLFILVFDVVNNLPIGTLKFVILRKSPNMLTVLYFNVSKQPSSLPSSEKPHQNNFNTRFVNLFQFEHGIVDSLLLIV
jgi:hypothetical protein